MGLTIEPKPKQYGLYDTQDNCWIGNDDGPLSYTDQKLAQISAQVCGVQLQFEPGRIRAAEIPATRVSRSRYRVMPFPVPWW